MPMPSDLEKGCRWTFGNPGKNTREEGPNNPSAENFKQEPYASLVRESIQNSLDAVFDQNRPVHVSFEIGSIRPSAYPEFFKLQDEIQECIDYYNEKAKKVYGNALAFFKSFQNQKDKSLYFIKVSDSNTRGMEYKENDTSSKFYSFVRSVGVSNKENSSAGGSFGFGKDAYFNISPIRSILVSTRTWTGKCVFEGVASLCTHRGSDGTMKASVGYYDNQKGFPVTKENEIPNKFLRKENGPGTDIYIMGIEFSDEHPASDIAKEMEIAVLRNFWLAILRKKLAVSIRYTDQQPTNIDITTENIRELIRNRFGENITDNKQGRGSDNYNPTPYLVAVTGSDEDNSDCLHFEEKLPLLGETHLYIYKHPEAKNRITYMRKPLMKVSANKFPDFNSGKFYGLFVCTDPKGNEKLRKMENPAHSEWDSKNWKGDDTIRTNPEAQNVEKEYKDFIRGCLEKAFQSEHSDTMEIEGLEDFLYIPTALENDIRQECRHETEEKQADTVEPKTQLASEKPRISEPKPQSVGKVFVNQPSKAIYSNKGDLYSGHSSKRSQCKGGGAGNRNLTAASREDEDGTPGTYAKAVPVRYRAYASVENGQVYHYIIIYSDQEIPNGRIELLIGGEQDVCGRESQASINDKLAPPIGGEQDDGRITIKDSSIGLPIRNAIYALHIPKCKPNEPSLRLRIQLDDNMKHAIKLNVHEHQ